MKPYSIDLRQKIVKVYEQSQTSIRKVAEQFNVSKAFVQKLLKQKQNLGHIRPQKSGGHLKSVLSAYRTQLTEMVEKQPLATVSEYCEYWLDKYNQSVSPSMMCRELQQLNLPRKKIRFATAITIQSESELACASIGRKSKILTHLSSYFWMKWGYC